MLQAGLISLLRDPIQCRLAADAPGAGLPSVRLAIISEGLNTWPLYVALDKGCFGREGVSVEVTLTRS